MIYLDTAALVKLVRVEAESASLVAWLAENTGEPLVSSALVEVELPRALWRSEPGVLGAVAAALGRLYRVDISAAVRATAAAYTDPLLRSLDAIHLATAEFLVASGQTLTAFVTYDKRLADVVRRAGLPIVAPGVVTSSDEARATHGSHSIDDVPTDQPPAAPGPRGRGSTP